MAYKRRLISTEYRCLTDDDYYYWCGLYELTLWTGMKRSVLGVRRSKVKVKVRRRRRFLRLGGGIVLDPVGRVGFLVQWRFDARGDEVRPEDRQLGVRFWGTVTALPIPTRRSKHPPNHILVTPHGRSWHLNWLVAWHSGRTSVFDRRTFAVLRSTCG